MAEELNKSTHEQGEPTGPEKIGDCQWCGKPAFTRLFVAGPKAKRGPMAYVCDDHERQFAAQGGVTERMEFQRKHGVDGIGPKAINEKRTT